MQEQAPDLQEQAPPEPQPECSGTAIAERCSSTGSSQGEQGSLPRLHTYIEGTDSTSDGGSPLSKRGSPRMAEWLGDHLATSGLQLAGIQTLAIMRVAGHLEGQAKVLCRSVRYGDVHDCLRQARKEIHAEATRRPELPALRTIELLGIGQLFFRNSGGPMSNFRPRLVAEQSYSRERVAASEPALGLRTACAFGDEADHAAQFAALAWFEAWLRESLPKVYQIQLLPPQPTLNASVSAVRSTGILQ